MNKQEEQTKQDLTPSFVLRDLSGRFFNPHEHLVIHTATLLLSPQPDLHFWMFHCPFVLNEQLQLQAHVSLPGTSLKCMHRQIPTKYPSATISKIQDEKCQTNFQFVFHLGVERTSRKTFSLRTFCIFYFGQLCKGKFLKILEK